MAVCIVLVIEADYITSLNSKKSEKDIINSWASEFDARQALLKASNSVLPYFNTFQKQIFGPIGKILVSKYLFQFSKNF